MILIFNNKKLNSSIEHELRAKNKYGFKATVTYKRNAPCCKHEKKQIVEAYNNCTEIHNMYHRAGFSKPDRIAFESDIHSVGCVRDIQYIKSVIITIQKSKAKYF